MEARILSRSRPLKNVTFNALPLQTWKDKNPVLASNEVINPNNTLRILKWAV